MSNNNNNTAAINLNETSVHIEVAAAIVAVLEAGNVAAIAATCNNHEALACKAEGNKVVFKHVHFDLTVEAGEVNLKGFTTPAEIAEYLKRAILNF